MGNGLAALGGIASGLGASLQHKADQDHEDKQKHLNMITGLVTAGLASGTVTDPDAAFKFLLNGGKPGGKDLPPALTTLVQSAGAMGRPGQAPGAGAGTGAGAGAGTDSSAPATATGSGSGSQTFDQSQVGGGSRTASTAMAPAPASTPAPTTSSTAWPGFGFKSAGQLQDEQVARTGRDEEAKVNAEYGAKLSLARRMAAGDPANGIPGMPMEQALTRVGMRDQRPVGGLAPRNIALPVPGTDVPPGALTISGEPYPTTSKYAQKTEVHTGWNSDGSPRWETRYEPSGPPASVTAAGNKAAQDPAKMRERVAELTAANPTMPADQIRAMAGAQLTKEAGTAAAVSGYRAQTVGEAAGLLPSAYSDVPPVEMGGDGKPDPVSQQAFEQKILAKPDGNLILANLKNVTSYKQSSNIFTQRQLGGLNREKFDALAELYDPRYDPRNYPAAAAMQKSWKGDGDTAKVMASAGKIVNHLEAFSKANKEMDKIASDRLGGITNPVTVGWQRIVQNDPKAQAVLARYKTIQEGISNELTKFYAGAGGGSLDQLKSWQNNFNPYGTSSERKASLQAAMDLMVGQVLPKVQQYKQVMGELPPNDLWLSDRDRVRLRKAGVDLSELPDSPAPPKTNGAGKTPASGSTISPTSGPAVTTGSTPPDLVTKPLAPGNQRTYNDKAGAFANQVWTVGPDGQPKRIK